MYVDEQGATAAHEAGKLFSLEVNQRLSASCLWEAQRSFFHRQGVEAWRTSTVPHYVTNNPALAHAYAEIVLGFLRDCRTPGASSSRPLDPAEPVHFVELGAGTGRFGFLFLKAFLSLHRQSAARDVPFRYVMTDFTRTNIDFLRAHRSLAPFLEEGVLDFAVFDAERDTQLELLRSGATLSPGSLANPLVVIANYVFDGISQDAFCIKDGQLHESLVSIASVKPAIDLESADPFSDLVIDYSHRPATPEYYPEPELNEILAGYVRSFGEATFVFPSTALRCARRLADLSGGRLLLLSGDRDEREQAFQRPPGDAGMSIHGSFSLLVNYHAMGEYFLRRNGQVLRTPHRHAHLDVLAFLLDGQPADHRELRLAYDQAMSRCGPDDFFNLRRGVHELYDRLGLEHLLSLIRMSRHDPRILLDCLPALSEQLSGATATARHELVETVARVWENYYPIGEERDVPFVLACLLATLGAHEKALSLFRESLALYGDDPRTRWNMGLCHMRLGDRGAALRSFEDAMALSPLFSPVGALQTKEE